MNASFSLRHWEISFCELELHLDQCVYGFNCYLIMFYRLKWAVTFSEGWSYFSPFHFHMFIAKDHIFGNGSSLLLMTGIRGISLMEMFKECIYFLFVFLITSHGLEMSVSLSSGVHPAFSCRHRWWQIGTEALPACCCPALSSSLCSLRVGDFSLAF